jgi:hypothetical protein
MNLKKESIHNLMPIKYAIEFATDRATRGATFWKTNRATCRATYEATLGETYWATDRIIDLAIYKAIEGAIKDGK